MSEKKSSVKVTIMGEEYTIRSDATAEHTRAVARYVDAAIRSVMDSKTVVESHKAAILAALQITAELFEARETRLDMATNMRRLSGDIARWLPPNKRI